MPNISTIFETTTKAIQSLVHNPKAPLHIGEVMSCWTYLAFVGEIIIYEEVGLNSTKDAQLKELCERGLHTANSHKMHLSDFMKTEGIPLPSLPADKPSSESDAIPPGAKFSDNELANAMQINFVIACDMCAAAASQSLRMDVGLMFLKFQSDKLILSFQAKELMQEKGWLKIPPAYCPPGLPRTQ